MPFFIAFLRRAYVAVAELAWTALLLLVIFHLVASWLLLSLAGEGRVVGHPVDFLYFYIVTATTVGYGDISPGSPLGRLIAAFFVLPGGIAIFTATLGKMLTGISGLWRRRMNGLGDYSERSGHLVVLGWDPASTRRLLEMLSLERAAAEPPTVLVAKGLEVSPCPDLADYVRTERLSDPAALERAGANGARALIVRGQNDDETLAAALVAADSVKTAHVVAYFQDERTSLMLRKQNPRIEAVGSLSSELLARSARDPGASIVATLLLSASSADTAYSIPVPKLGRKLRYVDALTGLKTRHRVTLVGIARDGRVDLNCDAELEIGEGCVLYYIADRRLDPAAIAWDRLGGATA